MLAVSGCSSDDEPASSAASAAASESPSDAASTGADIDAYAALLTESFTSNNDLDKVGASLQAEGVTDPSEMVEKLNEAAAEEGLGFTVGAVDPASVVDVICYVGPDDLYLYTLTNGPTSLTLLMGQDPGACADAETATSAATYVIDAAPDDAGAPVFTVGDASTDAEGAARLAGVAQSLVDGLAAEG